MTLAPLTKREENILLLQELHERFRQMIGLLPHPGKLEELDKLLNDVQELQARIENEKGGGNIGPRD